MKCSGFREFEEQLYPKFKVVTDKLPGIQKKVDQPKPRKMSPIDLDRLSPKLREKVLAELNE